MNSTLLQTTLPILSGDSLEVQINREHHAALASAHAALEHAINAGHLLIEAKKKSGFGNWKHWLQTHFEGSDRTARAYMQLANKWPEITADQNGNAVADLSYREALKLAAEPPKETRSPPAPVAKEPAPDNAELTAEPSTSVWEQAASRLVRACVDRATTIKESLEDGTVEMTDEDAEAVLKLDERTLAVTAWYCADEDGWSVVKSVIEQAEYLLSVSERGCRGLNLMGTGESNPCHGQSAKWDEDGNCVRCKSPLGPPAVIIGSTQDVKVVRPAADADDSAGHKPEPLTAEPAGKLTVVQAVRKGEPEPAAKVAPLPEEKPFALKIAGVDEAPLLEAVDQLQAALKVVNDLLRPSKGYIILRGARQRGFNLADCIKRLERIKTATVFIRQQVRSQSK